MLGTGVGYPVMDTTTHMGFFCSSGTSQSAVNTMCSMMGYKKGVKLPPGLFGNPSSPHSPFFVFEAVDCLGGEESIFDCDLAPWGVEGCEGEDILTIMCGGEEVEGAAITAMKEEDDDSGYSLLDDLFQHKNNEVQVTPTLQFSSAQLWFCPGQYLDNMEASALCQALGYGCGMVNYTQIQRNNSQQYNSKRTLLFTFLQL